MIRLPMPTEIVGEGSYRRAILELNATVAPVSAITNDHLYPQDESSHAWKLTAVLKLEKAVTIGPQESCPD